LLVRIQTVRHIRKSHHAPPSAGLFFGQRGYLDQLNGYANGGIVGGTGGAGLMSQPNVNITVHGAPSDPQVNVTQGQNGLDIDIAFGAIERRIAGGIADGSSMVGTSIKHRYGLREVV